LNHAIFNHDLVGTAPGLFMTVAESVTLGELSDCPIEFGRRSAIVTIDVRQCNDYPVGVKHQFAGMLMEFLNNPMRVRIANDQVRFHVESFTHLDTFTPN
jgi:hypothetical protein